MRGLERILDAARTVFIVLAAACLAVMIALNAVNIVVRDTTGSAFGFVFPWTTLLFIWSTFLALYPLVRDRRDVVVDVLVNRFPGPVRLVLALVADVLGILLFGMIFAAAPTVIGLQLGEMDMIPLPIFVQSLPLFLSAGMIVVHLAIHAAGLIAGTKRPFDHAHDGRSVEEGAPE